MKLKGKIAIITGASPGLGLGNGLAVGFAKEGANLSLNYFREDRAKIERFKAELEEYGVKVILTEGDISNEEVVKQLVSKTIEEYGRIDILVNSAGISTPTLLVEMDNATWDRMIEVNLKGVFLTTRHVVPHMIEQRSGRIINMSSQVGQKGSIQHSHYAAAKAGVIGFTKSIAIELGEYGITANCIAPGPIRTQSKATSEEWRNRKISELVIKRRGEVEEVIPTAILLAAEPDGNIYTGQTLGPNCGDVML